MTADNEVQLGNNVYTFASSGIAAAFLACMTTETLDHSKTVFPPVSVRTVPETPRHDDE
jgi:hypothetical protein